MSDFMQNVQEIYKKWETKSAPTIKSRFSQRERDKNYHDRKPHGSNQNFSNAPRFEKRKNMQRPALPKLPRFSQLAQFKMAPTVFPSSKSRPFMGRCCTKCFPRSRAAVPYPYVFSLGIWDVLQSPIQMCSTSKTFKMPKSVYALFYIFGSSRNAYCYPDVSSKVLESEKVLSAVHSICVNPRNEICISTEEGKPTSEEKVKIKLHVESILQDMKTSISSFLFRLSGLGLYNLFDSVFNCIHVNIGQMEMLKSLKQEDVPLIYLPLYQNPLDHILIPFILYMYDIRLPLTAVDAEFNLPVIRTLLRYLGTFFVNKAFVEADKVYAVVLEKFISECLKAGHSLEFFIKSDLSRIGKSDASETKLLSAVMNSILDDSVEDVYLVPVSISYEKLTEENFMLQQLGSVENTSKFMSAVRFLWKILHSNIGSVRIDFAQPFSLKEFIESKQNCSALKDGFEFTELSSSNFNAPELLHVHQCIINELSRHIVYDAVSNTALMSTHVVAFLFLTKHRQGATQQQLLSSLNALRGELDKRKHDVGFTGESATVIKHAIKLLGKELVTVETIEYEWTSSDLENNNMRVIFYKPIITVPYILELHYYASSVIPTFMLDSAAVIALYALLDEEICHFQHCESKFTFKRSELIDQTSELCEILQFEFISAPPCSDLSMAINDAVQELVAKECISAFEHTSYSDGRPQRSRGHCRYSFEVTDENDDDDDGLRLDNEPLLKVNLSEESIDYLEFLRGILSPYVESYWLAACTLSELVGKVKEVSHFIEVMQKKAEDRLHKGLLAYEESFAVGTFRNALKLFELWEIIQFHKEEEVRVLYLTEKYDCLEKINEVIARIERFRK